MNLIILKMCERQENIRAFIKVLLRKPTLDVTVDGHGCRCKNNINCCYWFRPMLHILLKDCLLDCLHTDGSTVFLNKKFLNKCQLLKLAFNLLANKLILVDKMFPLKKTQNYIFKILQTSLARLSSKIKLFMYFFSKMKHFFSNNCTYKDEVDANGFTNLCFKALQKVTQPTCTYTRTCAYMPKAFLCASPVPI